MLRDNLVELIEPMPNGAGADPLAPGASDDRLSCLENPRPAGAESSLTENVTSPFPAEPAQLDETRNRSFLEKPPARVNEFETNGHGIYRVFSFELSGLLIQASVGTAAGLGAWWTKRSGWTR
jgi:hypothetical protein